VEEGNFRRKVMTSFRRQLILAAALLLFAAAAGASAQTASRGQSGARMYDVTTETTIKATVESIEQITQGHGRRGLGGTHLVVKTERETLVVHVGPTAYMTQKGITFAKGDVLEILGSRRTIDKEAVLIAREIRKGANTWTLRDASGRPAWSGRRP
jgi:hypothetical protein